MPRTLSFFLPLMALLVTVSSVRLEDFTDYRLALPNVFDNMDLTSPSTTTFVYNTLPSSTGALCLDGSPYGYFICKVNNSTQWQIGIQGGGWCYDEMLCLERANTSLGSSVTWPAEAKNMPCDPNGPTNIVMMNYGDGASFTGYRADPWPVPGTDQSLYFRGIRNLDATLESLIENYDFASVTQLIVSGGSAGGLSSFLHLDHIADVVHSVAPNARVVGEPVCGMFLDHGNDGNNLPNVTYPLQMQYVYTMQNSSGSLSTACQNALGPDSWRCIMAPYAIPFIQTLWFALQSRFDHWQLSEIAFIPCMLAQSYSPPYKPQSCTSTMVNQIQSYGPDFVNQILPLFPSSTKNGIFLDACIIHGSTNSSINGKTNSEAFEIWLNGGQNVWIYQCNGSNSTGPCDPSPICAPF